jgi:hypothetical protein
VTLTEGVTSPDYSLYEWKEGNEHVDSNTFPTIVWEVAYSELEKKLVLDVARHICLSRGRIRLVVAINFTHYADTWPRELDTVTWAHWEVDGSQCEEVKKPVHIALNHPQPIGQTQPATSFEAYSTLTLVEQLTAWLLKRLKDIRLVR